MILLEAYGTDVAQLKEILYRVKKEPYLIKHLAVTGDDIINLGVKGREIGRVMDTLLDEVTKNPKLNSKDKLMALILEIK